MEDLMKESVLDLMVDDGPFLLNESDGPLSYILKALSTSMSIYGHCW